MTKLNIKGDLILKKNNIVDVNGNAIAPAPTALGFGELAVNYSAREPCLFFKDDKGKVIKIVSEEAITRALTDILGSSAADLDTLKELLAAFEGSANDVLTLIASKADKTALTLHADNKKNPHQVTKVQLGLGAVDNTSDADKPVSTKHLAALGLKLDRSSYTASDVLEKLKTVDGVGSGLDADTLDGKSSSQFFGVGVNLNDTDLNDFKSNAIGYGYKGMTNAAVQTISVIMTKTYSPDWIVQTQTVISDVKLIYTRTFYNGKTWSDWVVSYHSGNVNNLNVDWRAKSLTAKDVIGLSAIEGKASMALIASTPDGGYLDLATTDGVRGAVVRSYSSPSGYQAEFLNGGVRAVGDVVSEANITAKGEVTSYSLNGVTQSPTPLSGAEYLDDLLDVNVTDAAIGSLLYKKTTTEWGVIDQASLKPDLSAYITNADARLSDSRNAKDVHDWAKEATKPKYTKSEVGLSLVDNTSDVNKPVSTKQLAALGLKLDRSLYTARDILVKLKTVDGTGSGLDADTLDGKQACDLMGRALYNPNHGFLIKTAFEFGMFNVVLKINGYGSGEEDFITGSGYAYVTDTSIINTSFRGSHSIASEIELFYMDNKLCMWIPSTGQYQSLIAEVYHTTVGGDVRNTVYSVTDSPMPTAIKSRVTAPIIKIYDSENANRKNIDWFAKNFYSEVASKGSGGYSVNSGSSVKAQFFYSTLSSRVYMSNVLSGKDLSIYDDGRLLFDKDIVWHAGNSNLPTVDWAAKNVVATGEVSAYSINAVKQAPQAGATMLPDLEDVDTSDAKEGDVLKLEGTKWKSKPEVTYATLKDIPEVFTPAEHNHVGATYTASDERLKQNIKPLTNGLEVILSLNPVNYGWTDEAVTRYNLDKIYSCGLIAQKVEEILPNVVGEIDEQYKGVNYVELVPYLIGAAQQLYQYIVDQNIDRDNRISLEKRRYQKQVQNNKIITDLQAENKTLKERLDLIETLITKN